MCVWPLIKPGVITFPLHLSSAATSTSRDVVTRARPRRFVRLLQQCAVFDDAARQYPSSRLCHPESVNPLAQRVVGDFVAATSETGVASRIIDE